jgi:hypothetical protein
MNDLSLEDIQFRDTTEKDAPNLVEFARKIFHSEWNTDFVHWKYFDNPAGRVYGRVAEAVILDPDGSREAGGQEIKPVGFYGNIPVRLKLGEQVVTGAQAVDAMIAPEARRLGLFVRLNQQTYTQMDQHGLVLDYALPNPASEAGFVKRLGWQLVGQVPRYVKILDFQTLPGDIRQSGIKSLAFKAMILGMGLLDSSKSSTKRVSNSLTGEDDIGREPLKIRLADAFDERCDSLWQEASAAFSNAEVIAVQRDRVYLDWRYVKNPRPRHTGKNYQILLAERGELLTGLAVLSFRDEITQRSAALTEWFVLPGDAEAGQALLAAAELSARQRACAQIQCWMLSQYTLYTNLLRRNRYLASASPYAPNYLRYTTPLIIRQNPALNFTNDPGRIESWYLTMGDHDYY